MKKYLVLSVFVSSFLSSCSVIDYYQVIKTNSLEGKIVNDKITFEDSNCVVSYYLWADGGKIGFNFFNKTNEYIAIDLTKTFFVANGVANEYYQGKSTTTTASIGSNTVSSGKPVTTNSVGLSTTYNQQAVMNVPPMTSINVNEYKIITARLFHCNLYKYPTRRNIKSVTFDSLNSPLQFYNSIAYTLNNSTKTFVNRFYIQEITNYPSDKMYKTVYTNQCGDKLPEPEHVFKFIAPNTFYFKYRFE